MNLASVRIIAADVDRLTRFYETVTGVAAQRSTPDFSEVVAPSGTLAIGSTKTLVLFGADGVAEAGANRSAIIEFRVDDVDAEHERLAATIGNALAQAPTTMRWGNRSLLFRDPDGTLVNLFAPVTPEASRHDRRRDSAAAGARARGGAGATRVRTGRGDAGGQRSSRAFAKAGSGVERLCPALDPAGPLQGQRGR